MQNLLTILQAMASQAIAQAFPEIPHDSSLTLAEVAPSTHPQFGHYQCNSALKIARVIKKQPREVAQKMIHALEQDELSTSMIAKLEIAGPGFINIVLKHSLLASDITKILLDPRLGVPKPEKIERVIVEFSSPNIAKELHVGHLRSTIIGDCLARVLEFLGHDVLRLNHIGDWGTQFGMLIAFIQEYQPQVLSQDKETDLPSLMQWYKQSKQIFDENAVFRKRAQEQVVALQGGDLLALAAWEKICAISRKAFEEIYNLLDIKLDERGESFYNPHLADLVKDMEQKGLVTVSDGAKCVFMDGFVNREGDPLPMIIQKSDGGYNYETTDMAALRHRVEVEKADRIVVVTDAGQSLHFQMVLKAGELAGYYDPALIKIDHVTFGVVLGADGKKFKTRSGHTERLIDLLLEAMNQARNILKEKMPDAMPQEVEGIAKILGIDAVKYADLSCHRIKDYVFSYDRMLRFDGNTAAFLLYAYVRVQGIKRRIQKDPLDYLDTPIVLQNPSEIALALHLRQFGEAIDLVERDLLPNRLTDYLYELAEKFHAFFRDCRVEGDEFEVSRLLLCEAAARILQQGLHLLGLKTVEKM